MAIRNNYSEQHEHEEIYGWDDSEKDEWWEERKERIQEFEEMNRVV